MSKTTDWVIKAEERDLLKDDGYEARLIKLAEKRQEAEDYIDAYYKQGMNIKDLFPHIWHASTVILPKLEVQVVIDGNNAIHISSGSAGFVSFTKSPTGLKLPVRCWIHTHPFGAAYFSGTDWNTVNTWLPLMETAYVLGGEEHWGYWIQGKPNQLVIRKKNGIFEIQLQRRDEEE